jgi:TatD DNase family protein
VLAGIEELAARPRVVAVGETGLDYYRHHAEPGVQRWWFREHIKIAKRTGKALMIHDREAHADVLRILEEEGPPDQVVFHCFSGDVAMVKQCAEAGYVMSFAGNVTYRNAQPLRDAAAAAPLELLLAETDAPFLTPVPNRGKPNEPALTADTLRCLAEVTSTDLADLCDTVTATAQRTFGSW